MNGPYFIEVLARNDDVKERHSLPTLPIRIGRAYDNDLILDDPYSAPHHALILANEQGELIVRDVASKNGIICQNQRHQELTLDGSRVFRLGHSKLRVRTANFQVAEELADSTNHNWEGWPPALLGLSLIASFVLCRGWLLNDGENGLIVYLMALGSALGIAGLWAGGWAFINKMFDNHHRLGRHVFIAACGYATIEIVNLLGNILGYAFSLSIFTSYDSLLEIAIITITLYFHLSTVQPHYPRRIQSICLGLLVLFTGYNLMNNYQHTGILADELYMSQLLPPAMRLAPTDSLDTFFNNAKTLKEKVDQASRKPLQGANDE
jgi:pSer/pThr/pTyr-binding forkhead associated (FHA) protein